MLYLSRYKLVNEACIGTWENQNKFFWYSYWVNFVCSWRVTFKGRLTEIFLDAENWIVYISEDYLAWTNQNSVSDPLMKPIRSY